MDYHYEIFVCIQNCVYLLKTCNLLPNEKMCTKIKNQTICDSKLKDVLKK